MRLLIMLCFLITLLALPFVDHNPSDYVFLEEALRLKNNVKRQRPPAPKYELPHYLSSLVREVNKRNLLFEIVQLERSLTANFSKGCEALRGATHSGTRYGKKKMQHNKDRLEKETISVADRVDFPRTRDILRGY